MSSSTHTEGAPAHRADAPESPSTDSTRDAAKEQAGQLGQGARERGQDVAGTAKEQAGQVKDEAAAQAQNLFEEAKDQFGDHAEQQRTRAAESLRSLSSELSQMAEGADHSGPAADLARRAGEHTRSVAGWLEGGDAASLLEDVRSFASRRPGTFLALAAGAGLLAGRLTRGLKDSGSQPSARSDAAPQVAADRSGAPRLAEKEQDGRVVTPGTGPVVTEDPSPTTSTGRTGFEDPQIPGRPTR